MNAPNRGIVIPFTRLSDLPGIWVCVNVLALHGCTLPVRIAVAAGGRWHSLLRELFAGLERVSLLEVKGEDARRHSWLLAICAVLAGDFDEVLMMAAHTIPLRDPAELFEHPSFVENGVVLWPRFASPLDRSAVFEKFGLPPRMVSEIDDSQLLVSASRHRAVLEQAIELSGDAVLQELLWGNMADHLKFALYRGGTPFSGIRMRPQPLFMEGTDHHVILAGMCHFDVDDEQTFQNRKRYPWSFTGDRGIGGGMFEPQCLEFLRKLRGRLTPLFNTGASADFADSLAGEFFIEWQQKYRKANDAAELADEGGVNLDAWTRVKLCADGVVETGSDLGVCFWRGGSGGIVLLDADWEIMALLSSSRDGVGTAFLGEWVSTKRKFRMLAKDAVLPEVRPLLDRRIQHLLCGADTMEDAVMTLFAACALVNEGSDVVLHTKQAEWLHRVSHPGLAIAYPLGNHEYTVEPRRANYATPLLVFSHRNLDAYRKNGASLQESKCRAVRGDLAPARPARVDTAIHIPRLDFVRYVVIVPFSDEAEREWPIAHWLRLAELMRAEGFDVVAIGHLNFAERASSAFGQSHVFWASGDSTEWMVDVMLGAEAVISTNNGLAHVAALHGVRTVCIVAEFTAEYFAGLPMEIVGSPSPCAGCFRDADKGYLPSCRAACSALLGISPEQVCERIGQRVPATTL